MHCSQCGAAAPDAAKFCPACGAAVLAAPTKAGPPQPTSSEQAKGCAVLLGLGVAVTLLFKACGGPSTEQKAAETAKVSEEREKGFHCLSGWDGSNRSLVDQVKQQLRDPGSFEHDETKITPNRNGSHMVSMRYRAKNGFGGMNVTTAIGTIDHETCAATIVSTGT